MSQNYEYFGKYILLEKLATGGMAEVWLARAPGAGGIGKFVAIKKILPQFSDNPEFIQMFKDEAAIAMNLSHSNIVSIYEFGQEKNQLFLVMDYVEGRNLRQLLNKMKQSNHSFSTDQIIYISKEVAAGLDHAHRSLNSATGKPLNITHRDMSPQNVMITFEGEVKIVDFGIAKAESQIENTRTGTLKGKFGYMSPEQAEGLVTDLRTDVFSLGICLWELLANERLFISNNEINTLKKIRECAVPSLTKINPNIHVELERITMKALTRDRNLRYQTAAALHRDLSRFMNRQFPDFSHHDFSVFIKTLYTDEILELRQRLIDYAKIPFKPTTVKGDNSDKTMVTSFPQVPDAKTKTSPAAYAKASGGGGENTNPTLTATETFTDAGSGSEKTADSNSETEEPQAHDQIQLSSISHGGNSPPSGSENPSILNDKFLKDSLIQKIVVTPKMPSALPKEEGEAPVPDGYLALEKTGPGNKIPTNQVKQRKAQNKIKPHNYSINIMIFVACAIVTYVVASTYFPRQTAKVELLIGKVLGIKEYASQPEQPPHDPEKYKIPSPPSLLEEPDKPKPVASDFQTTTVLVVNSIPSGADIYLNGLATGETTPSRIEVPADKPFSITLKLARFLDYTKANLTTDITGRTLNATLQKALVGYIDIDVKPPVGARVTVNGQVLREKILPITHYAVPAGTPVVVQAENPVSGAMAQETITLREDQRYKVILQLDKKRNPSGR